MGMNNDLNDNIEDFVMNEQEGDNQIMDVTNDPVSRIRPKKRGKDRF